MHILINVEDMNSCSHLSEVRETVAGFLLLRLSVLFTVESLFLLISFLYLDLYVLGDDALCYDVEL